MQRTFIGFLGTLLALTQAALAQDLNKSDQLEHDAPPFSAVIPDGFEPYAAPSGYAYGYRKDLRSLGVTEEGADAEFAILAVALMDSPVQEDEKLQGETGDDLLHWNGYQFVAMPDLANIGQRAFITRSVDLPVKAKAIRVTAGAPLGKGPLLIPLLQEFLHGFQAETYFAPTPVETEPVISQPKEETQGGFPWKWVVAGAIIGFIAQILFASARRWNASIKPGSVVEPT